MRNSFLIAVSVLVLDQISKWLALTYLAAPNASFKIIDDFFQLKLYQNSGIAFSINLPQIVIILLTYILLALGLFFAYKELDLRKHTAQILLGMVVGGAIGNLFDRVTNGSVIDFIAIANYPVFNIADIGIVIGLAGIVIFYNKISRKKSR